MTQICVSKFIIIGSDNGLSPIRRQAIIWTNAGILLIRTLGRNFSEILIQINTFSNKKMHLKMPSGKCRPFCLGFNVLITTWIGKYIHIKVWLKLLFHSQTSTVRHLYWTWAYISLAGLNSIHVSEMGNKNYASLNQVRQSYAVLCGPFRI